MTTATALRDRPSPHHDAPAVTDLRQGRHLSVHDDLDALLARLQEVRDHDLYVLRPDPLSSTSTPNP